VNKRYMGSKTLKAVKKRFKITKKGRMLRRKASLGHGQSKETSKTIKRRRGYTELDKTIVKKIKEKYL